MSQQVDNTAISQIRDMVLSQFIEEKLAALIAQQSSCQKTFQLNPLNVCILSASVSVASWTPPALKTSFATLPAMRLRVLVALSAPIK
jgi:hypothetical protein